MMESFRDRLIRAMDIRGIKATDLAKKTGLSKAQISQYTNGVYEAKQTALHKLAVALDVSEAWLMGYDVPMERMLYGTGDSGIRTPIFPVSRRAIPMLGSVSCGVPKLATEEHNVFVAVGEDISADFCLRANGDSMTGARIYDGDIVFVKSQEMVENGEIAVVLIDDEATLKRAYWYEEQQVLILRPENPAYKELVFAKEDLDTVKIIGKAIAFQAML